MKEYISNDVSTILIIFAVIVSVLLTTVALAVTDTGTAAVNINEVTEVNFTTASVDWGTGSVTSGSSSCILNTNASTNSGCTDFTEVNAGLTLENIGSEDVQLNISSDKAAAAFLGGTSPSFQWKITNTTGSCNETWGLASYTEITTTAVDVCANFDATDATDDVNIQFQVVLPSDTTLSGAQTATITATATENAD